MVAMSHVFVDCNTQYRIQNMLLNAKEQVEALDATEKQQIKAMGGKAEYKIFQSPAFVVTLIGGVLKEQSLWDASILWIPKEWNKPRNRLWPE